MNDPGILRKLPAEWELQSGIQLTFPHENTDWADDLENVINCFVQIIELICRYQKVLVVCREKKQVAKYLGNCNVKHLILVEIPSNDSWARDHAAITVFERNQALLLDFEFNGWGEKFPANLDNQITRHLYEKGVFSAVKIETPGIILEGGSIESDGLGTLLTTSKCLLSPRRNPHLDQAQLFRKLRELLGFKRILWLHHGELIGDDTDAHIDTLARFCNGDTIAYVRCNDRSDPHYDSLQKMEKELRSFRTPRGNPYHLVPLPLPEACFAKDGHRLPATYANFLIINEAVLVPQYGVEQDERALMQLKTCFTHRKIVGINCRPLIEQHGSLHCIAMQYPAGVL